MTEQDKYLKNPILLLIEGYALAVGKDNKNQTISVTVKKGQTHPLIDHPDVITKFEKEQE